MATPLLAPTRPAVPHGARCLHAFLQHDRLPEHRQRQPSAECQCGRQCHRRTGYQALKVSTGSSNTAIGNNALLANTTGANNIAIGSNAGNLLTTGSNNIDIGHVGVAGNRTSSASARARPTPTSRESFTGMAWIHWHHWTHRSEPCCQQRGQQPACQRPDPRRHHHRHFQR